GCIRRSDKVRTWVTQHRPRFGGSHGSAFRGNYVPGKCHGRNRNSYHQGRPVLQRVLIPPPGSAILSAGPRSVTGVGIAGTRRGAVLLSFSEHEQQRLIDCPELSLQWASGHNFPVSIYFKPTPDIFVSLLSAF